MIFESHTVIIFYFFCKNFITIFQLTIPTLAVKL
jgi:hypothetical protein